VNESPAPNLKVFIMKKVNLLVLLFTLAIVTLSFGQSKDSSPCSSPDNLYVNQVTGTSATFNWIPAAKTSGWNFEIGPVGFTPGTVSFTGRYFYYHVGPSMGLYLSYGITDLEPNTKYAVYTRTMCSDGKSEWEGPAYFLTDKVITIGLSN